MTAKSSRRVVIINNIKSEMIEQAIFILRNEKNDRIVGNSDNSIVSEAQSIINNYIKQVERTRCNIQKEKNTKKKNRIKEILFVLLSISALIVAIIFASQLIGILG